MSELDPLKELRSQIDAMDDRLVALLNERSAIVLKIGEIKKSNNAHFHTPAREQAIYDRLVANNPGPFPNESLKHVFREIMGGSLSLEKEIRVAYLGPEATFTHQACLQRFSASVFTTPVHTIKDVFEAVEKGCADFGIVPVENSIEGMVSHTLDLFVDSPLLIYGEVLQEVSHSLMSKTGKKDAISQIISHPQAIAQCHRFLETHFKTTTMIDSASTAKAAQMAAMDTASAAIASTLAARLYGLTIIEEKIEDYANNVTRFLVVSKKSSERTPRDKTSLLLSIKDKSGALHDLLKPFAEQGINLMKIESRPSKKRAWEYLFYIDIAGNQAEEKIHSALEQIAKEALFLKVLGSYPMADAK